MKRWKLYFAFEHLPPHLQAVSKPFCDLAERIHSGGSEAMAFANANGEMARMAPHDADQMAKAFGKLRQALHVWLDMRTEDAMDLVLEAKDCAVRAHIPDPPEPAAKAAP